MCGIFGITGVVDPFAEVLEGLSLLEYRGYDSAGVAICDGEAAQLFCGHAAQRAHSLSELRAIEHLPRDPGSAIGHTRWATHGAPVVSNAHPMRDCSGRVAIVHNGVIENHRELRAQLLQEGHRFSSETDSEVIAHLVERERVGGVRLVDALRIATACLRGDFAIGAICADEPNVIAAARRTSPLVVANANGVGLLASDVAALVGRTHEMIEVGDDELVEITPSGVTAYARDGAAIVPRSFSVAWDAKAAQKGGYEDFMSKEMREQPGAVANTLLGRINEQGETDLEELQLSRAALAAVERVMLVACGSSYHACLAGRQMVESLAGLHCDAEIASEFRYRDPVIEPGTLVLGVSQSGETNDTLNALREARRRGATVVVMTNVVDSLMARESDGVLYTRAGPEIGVASTKCHVAQLALLEVFALHLANARGTITRERAAEHAQQLLVCPDLVASAIARADEVAAIARRFSATRDFYYLGRRMGYPIALEGALKLKEIAYVRAEAYAAGEMKHGPISLIEPGSVVVVLATRTPVWDKVMTNVSEMKARGATVLAVANEGDAETAGAVDAVLEVPVVSELCSPIVDVVPLQLFAYEVARAHGNDVDRPRNLAKVVTVE